MDANTTRKNNYANEKQKEAISAAVTDIWNTRRLLETKTRPCRERSLALTKLDEATFWIKSIPYEMDDDGWGDAFRARTEGIFYEKE